MHNGSSVIRSLSGNGFLGSQLREASNPVQRSLVKLRKGGWPIPPGC
jgi:hypothetical protein